MNPNAVDAVVVSYDSGSTIDACLRALLAQPEAYEIVSFNNEAQAPAGYARLQPAW